ncbi:MAG TPA: sterol desaturase family protein [Nevskiales bacterium]|nr:sterol desaturase family protein [Nevskiales bacterium]
MIEHEAGLRLGVFIGVLTTLALAEALWPRRPACVPRGPRWLNNLTIVALDSLLLRLLFPVLAVDWALEVQARGWGLFNQVGWASALEFALALLLLDLAIYWQHRIMHRIPLLWRLHRVHHSDLDFDASTGVRFHPLEILLSMLIKLAAVTVLGAAALAVLVFEALLNATSLFEHANLRIPAPVDRRLRWLLVTPDMHRVHHSVHGDEYNRNFGFNFPWWDRLFGSYRAQPRDGHLAMTIGLRQFRAAPDQRLDRLLLQPLSGP